jgi:hypothetical protein
LTRAVLTRGKQHREIPAKVRCLEWPEIEERSNKPKPASAQALEPCSTFFCEAVGMPDPKASIVAHRFQGFVKSAFSLFINIIALRAIIAIF